jgi:glucose-6-phosphate isomerase
VCSAVGMLPLSLQYSSAIMKQFLGGAHTMDKHFFECPLRFNLPVNLGLVGVWNSSFLGFNTRAILPCTSCTASFATLISIIDYFYAP